MIVGLIAAGWLGVLGTGDSMAREFRSLEAPPAVVVPTLAPDQHTNPVRLVKVVIEPRIDRPWAFVYTSSIYDPDHPPPPDQMITWEHGGPVAQIDSFARIVDEEMQKAGFTTSGSDSLFGEQAASDLKLAVLVDDIQGRFCMDCPNLFRPNAPAGVAVMNARWEVYSTARSTVVAKITTHGGATERRYALSSGSAPIVLDAFRENVRLLLASEDFRHAVTESTAVVAPVNTPISLVGEPHAPVRIADASGAVVQVFTTEAMGSGVLVSSDGYILTAQHVVGDAKRVKIRWSDGFETVGEVVRFDKRRDVALLKSDTHGRRPLAVERTVPELGAAVFAIGSPLDPSLQNTVTRGVISGRRISDGFSFIQSDTPVTHGNSGGPLLNQKGAVVGLADWIYRPDGQNENLNFFIPVGDALDFLALKPAP